MDDNKNMACEYTFTTEDGQLVRQKLPFSVSSAVMQTPCLNRYPAPAGRYASMGVDQATGEDMDLVTKLTANNVDFSYMDWAVIRELVDERVRMRDANRAAIMGRITDISGEIYAGNLIKTPEGHRQSAVLERLKLDLEKQARDEDICLWKDLVELRRDLIPKRKQYESSKSRAGLMASLSVQNGGNQTEGYSMGAGCLPGAQAGYR